MGKCETYTGTANLEVRHHRPIFIINIHIIFTQPLPIALFTTTMTCVIAAMYIDSLAYDDSFAIHEFNDESDEDVSFHDSEHSMCSLDKDGADLNESTEANYSSSSFNSIDFEDDFEDDCDVSNTIVHSTIIKSPLKASRGQGKISFGGVGVREYTVVVGSQSISCPLELDWDFVEYSFSKEEDYRVNSGSRSKKVRPLSYQERKQIIAVSQGVSISNVKYLEQEMLDLQNNKYVHDIIFDSGCKRGVKRVDSPPRQPRSESKQKTAPSVITTEVNDEPSIDDDTTAYDAMNKYVNDNAFDPEYKRGVKRVDSPPRLPRSESQQTTTTTILTEVKDERSTRDTTAYDAMMINLISTRTDAPPRRPSNSYD